MPPGLTVCGAMPGVCVSVVDAYFVEAYDRTIF